LLIFGDSLVRGVGCDNTKDSSPVFPRVLARILSLALRADVEWRAEGLIGATVTDIRTKFLPIIDEELNQEGSNSDEYLVVLICGLNDWKTLLTNFPLGSGPSTFRLNLDAMVADIKLMAGSKRCTVYLPAVPISCGSGDPHFILGQAPLKYFIDFISTLWDNQKRLIAESNPTVYLHIYIYIYKLDSLL
jgi:hypothetical protein